MRTLARNSITTTNGNGINHHHNHLHSNHDAPVVENGHVNNHNAFPPSSPPPPLSPIRTDLQNNHCTTTHSREHIMGAEVPPPEDPEHGEIRTISHPNVANEEGSVDPHRSTVTTQSTTLDSSSPDVSRDIFYYLYLPIVLQILSSS